MQKVLNLKSVYYFSMKKVILLTIYVVSFYNGFGQNDDKTKEKPKKKLFYSSFVSVAPSNGVQGSGIFAQPERNGTITLDIKGFANYYLIRDYLSFGGGIMLSRTYAPNFNQFWFMGELKGYLSDEINTIYLYIQGGKSIPIGDVFINGQGLGIGAGYRFEAFENVFMVEISSFNRSVQFDNLRYGESKDKVLVTGVYMGIGFQF